MSENGKSRKIEFDDPKLTARLFGPHNSHLELLGEKTGTRVDSRGNVVTLREGPGGSEGVELAANVLSQLYGLLQSGTRVYAPDVDCACRILEREPHVRLKNIFQDTVYAASPRKTIAPKTLSQHAYLNAIRNNDLVFGVGPAGTGKTYLAVAMAVAALTKREVKRIVLTRPAVEAGEKLGFLPGDLVEKINPYLRPLYDALHDMVDVRKVQEMLESDVIEIAPLAFMRGRTLNDAFVILDEAQNTTPEQMKMFLTRLGFGSKAVVTGDVTQIDLPITGKSGLVEATRILENTRGISIQRFAEEDVIRHPLVQRIVQAYDKWNRAAEGQGGERRSSRSREEKNRVEGGEQQEHNGVSAWSSPGGKRGKE